MLLQPSMQPFLASTLRVISLKNGAQPATPLLSFKPSFHVHLVDLDTLYECQHGMRCMDVINPESVLKAMIKVSRNRLTLTDSSTV